MSSGAELMALMCLGVGKHGAVDGVRDPALEGPDGFLAGGTGFLSAIEVGPGVVPRTSLREGDSVNRFVELSVAPTAEPVPLGVA
jgi:hypothetical protein